MGDFLATKGDSEHDKRIGAEILSGKRHVGDFRPAELTAYDRGKIEKYLPAAMVFDFTFDMSEDNDFMANADFIDTFTHQVFTLGIKAESDHQRQTIRQFRVSNTFNDLIGSGGNCVPDHEPNWNYPIAGNIGLAEMVKTFVDLNAFEGLAGKSASDAAPQLADTLVFQTNLSASIAPKVTLTPVKLGPRLTDASIGPGAFRKDNHKVIVGISLPVVKGSYNYFGGSFFGQAFGSSSGNSPAASALTSANRLVDEQIGRNIINTLAVRP